MGLQNSNPSMYSPPPSPTKTTPQLRSIYSMYTQSIKMVRSNISQDKPSGKNRSRRIVKKSTLREDKFSNLESVFDQLLEKFAQCDKYVWGNGICTQFKHYFMPNFEDVWLFDKEQFYELLLNNCGYATKEIEMDLQTSESFIGERPQVSSFVGEERVLSFERYFYDRVAQKISGNIPDSFIQQEGMDQIMLKGGQMMVNNANGNKLKNNRNTSKSNPKGYKGKAADAINASIVDECDHDVIKQDNTALERINDHDFLPFFPYKPNVAQSTYARLPSDKSRSHEAARHIQSSSVVMPQAIFTDRLSAESKLQIYDLVKFYRQFSNSLQQVVNSCSLVGCPLKHFIYVLKEKMDKKKIRHSSSVMSSNVIDMSTLNSTNGSSLSHQKQVMLQRLLAETPEGDKLRRKRQFNNDLLLKELKTFAQAYTDFIFKYLQFHQISQTKLGKLITVDTVYGIIVKCVWNFVEWIGERGFEYQDEYVGDVITYNKTGMKKMRIEESKLVYLSKILSTLYNQGNPQKYLKKIVILYRQTSKSCETADDLLNILEYLLCKAIEEGHAKELGLFRLQNTIEKLLKMDECYLGGGGQISYSWTSWCVLVEMLKSKVRERARKKMKGGQIQLIPVEGSGNSNRSANSKSNASLSQLRSNLSSSQSSQSPAKTTSPTKKNGLTGNNKINESVWQSCHLNQ